MKHPLKYCLCILLTGLAIITACKKEKSCEGYKENNKPQPPLQGLTSQSLYQPIVFHWMVLPPVIRMGR
ncbi:MAG TPA: hypothetical protein VFU29_01855 [Chitinophagaceae bacterium]|nr:hypothetical protein [Chitinophagaceae bacterium]